MDFLAVAALWRTSATMDILWLDKIPWLVWQRKKSGISLHQFAHKEMKKYEEVRIGTILLVLQMFILGTVRGSISWLIFRVNVILFSGIHVTSHFESVSICLQQANKLSKSSFVQFWSQRSFAFVNQFEKRSFSFSMDCSHRGWMLCPIRRLFCWIWMLLLQMVSSQKTNVSCQGPVSKASTAPGFGRPRNKGAPEA